MISVGSEVQILPGPPTVVGCQVAVVRPVWALETGDCFGDVAQLGEHLLCKQGVVGSNPIVSISMVDRQLSVVRPIAVGVSRRKSEFGAACPAEAGCVAPLTPPNEAFVLWQCESGSGASLGALRCVCLTGGSGVPIEPVRWGPVRAACNEARRSETFGSRLESRS